MRIDRLLGLVLGCREQGRLKIDGAYERVLFGLRPVTAGGAFAAFAAEVRALANGE